jgi:hypothetical protein
MSRAAVPIAGALVLAIAATISLSRSDRVPGTPIQSTELVVDLPKASRSDRQRVFTAAREAVERYTEWLGPYPDSTIRVASNPWRQPISPASELVMVDVPWRSAPESMDLESQAAFGIARRWWPALRASNDPEVDGLAWYLQSRVVDRLYDLSFLVPAHSAIGVRYFGGVWPWTFRILPLTRWSGGLGREEYLRSQATAYGPPPARRLPPNLKPAALRSALAFATLERYLGWPTLQGALSLVTAEAAHRPLRLSGMQQIIESAAGQDLSWFFATAFDTSKSVDYAIRDLTTGETSPCGSGPCFRTRVTVVRNGTGEFSGTSSPASESFDVGDAMELRVAFADSQAVSTRWDGRAGSRIFEFDSVAAAVSAVVDPVRMLLVDENLLNNELRRDMAGGVAVRKWIAYWMVWLEGAVLDYGLLF